MNCNCGFGAPVPLASGNFGIQGAASGQANPAAGGRFPAGMGYVPLQSWETPYPMDRALVRGTIFPSLDLPFMMGRCR